MAGGYTGWTGFDAARFRSAIRFVFTMAEPPSTVDQLVFHWNPTSTSAGPKSGDGVPFNPTQAITTTTPPTVKRPYLVEYVDAAGEPTPFGKVIPSRVRVWLLDGDYDDVKTADYVVISGDRYERDHEEPSYGLFDVGIHCCTYSAMNET